MKSKIVKWLVGTLAVIGVLYIAARAFGPGILERQLNRIVDNRPFTISTEAEELHRSLRIMDWHADTLLWNRSLLERADRGHVDVPRLQDGNMALQMFTTVTKTPRNMNVHANEADSDNITLVSYLQGWPSATHSSLLARALYQAGKLDDFIQESEGSLMWVRSQAELKAFLAAHQSGASPKPIAALLGTEGAHPLEGDIANVDKMFEAGFRMVGLTHFFDNELGGSLHGVSKAGLTDFGKQVVRRLDELEIIIDLAHASEQSARDALAITSRGVVVSHTGFRGACDTERNFSDDLMKEIAAKGGLIAVGYWETAVCGTAPQDIAKAIAYGIDLVGADHVALGSDWDGAVTAMPSDHMPAITAALLDLGVSTDDIRQVMGESSINFLHAWLPE
ncbi:dipeptidase [Kordiimonas sp.]|uniref:dipeptidase n=1 Tax=Kordiimonas sp. TaxID=1970157 RepID=UPI003A951A11